MTPGGTAMPVTTYQVHVTPSQGKEIASPSFSTREDAIEALNSIREAQKNRVWVELDWLSISGENVISARLIERGFGGVSFA